MMRGVHYDRLDALGTRQRTGAITPPERAELAVLSILSYDVNERTGQEEEWEGMEPEVQDDIIQSWTALVAEAFNIPVVRLKTRTPEGEGVYGGNSKE